MRGYVFYFVLIGHISSSGGYRFLSFGSDTVRDLCVSALFDVRLVCYLTKEIGIIGRKFDAP